ncbi:Hypothetical predicted protein [Octopus vulgaris]|uniref:Uncharacterized protein n=1 Tax=Octopus vulgaris TaxID=6645 RepID=A0AA36FM64_OCTVU|nr:Hypothetical predicted protein [Octopus vulgaris]
MQSWSAAILFLCLTGVYLVQAQISEATADTEDSTDHDITEKSITAANKSEILTTSPKLETGVKAEPESRPDNGTNTQTAGVETVHLSTTVVTATTITALTVISAITISGRFY